MNIKIMNKKKLSFIMIGIVSNCLFALNAQAANHFVRQGATGSANGNDWTNAYTSLPATLVRGDTYYIGAGSYSGRDFNTAASGTTVITIKKAIESDHGTNTGWQSSYGTGQAIFAGSGVSFSSNYWVFDGTVGSGSNPNAYGFYFTPPNSGSSIRPVVYNGSYVQIRHAAVTCPGPSNDIQQFGFSGTGNSVTTDYTYVNNCQVSYWNQGSNNVISNSYLGTYWSSTANHGVHVEQIDNPSFFNNIVTSCDIQCIEPGGGSTTNISNGKYYNNVFVNVKGSNGVLKGVSSGAIKDTVIYGNTFINVAGPILYQNNAGLGSGSGNVIVNNVLYNSPTLYEQAGGGAISHSYNAFFSSGTISETGVQIGSGDPFVSYATGDYRLKAATQSGLALPSPYNLDINGDARGANGVWDRGAYELAGGSLQIQPPLNLLVTFTP
ncbi:MAG: hypothetical protein M0R47_21255 [Methylobacter sp.]|nr:hypothetical protein [Methylobacter sp.]